MNPQANYHFCNETLRKKFYTSVKWKIEGCRKHSIFLSQAAYPLKGLHQVLKSVSLLIAEFPDIHISIAGANITRGTSFNERLRLSGYGHYIRGLINRYNLERHITFTGALTEDKMVEAYLHAHVFVCPSMIENSPNSLGEAQLLGVPCVAAQTGGITDMIVEGETGIMYRFEEFEMLAEGIRKLFSDTYLAEKLSKNGILSASKRHDPVLNFQRTLEIYNEVNTPGLV